MITEFTPVQIEAARLEVRVNELQGKPSADWLKAIAAGDPAAYRQAATRTRGAA